MTDSCRIHGNLRAIIDIGEPIEVSGERARASTLGDPLTNAIRDRLTVMLNQLQFRTRTQLSAELVLDRPTDSSTSTMSLSAITISIL